MEFRLPIARLSACCGLLILLAMLAPQTAVAAPCVAGPTTLCLNDQRFKLEVQWKDFAGNTGVGQAVSLTSDTGYFWFFNSTNVELVVKVLDGRGLNAHYWVFFGALSNVEYTMSVTDSVSGSVKTYFNTSGQFASVGDTEAFSASGSVSAAQRYVAVNDGSMSAGKFPLTSSATAHAVAAALNTCVSTATTLCLNGGRFRVAVNWKDFAGNTGAGKAISLTADTGYFWFFNSTNVELVVKVLDARGLNNRFWVFYGALSNVEYEMTVTDTLTGNINRYSNPSGRFASTGDTEGFRAGYGVTARLDPSRAASADIPTTGGIISATAADGSVFTLTIPDGALFSDAQITMTPVGSIDGLPLSGGLAAAVKLAPEGLLLFKPATLTINPSTAIPIDEEMTFALRGTGEEFFLYPPVPLNTAAVSMTISYLATYGAGRGTGDDQAVQQQRPPASRHDQHKQNLQDPAAAQRRELRHGKAGGSLLQPLASNRLLEAAINYLTDYLNNVLFLNEPTKCSDDWKGFLSKVKGFEQDVINLTGQDPALMQAARTYYENVYNLLVKCYDEAYQRCKSDKDPNQGGEMLRIYAALRGNGESGRVDHGKIPKCLTFELTFVNDMKEPPLYSHKLTAVLLVSISSAGPGSTDNVYVPTYIVKGGCAATVAGGPSIFWVPRLSADINVAEASASSLGPLTMDFDPGNPSLTLTLRCPDDPPVVLGPYPMWRALFNLLHLGEEGGSSVFQAKDWTLVGSDVYAHKTVDHVDEEFSDKTDMDLRHKPE